MTALPPNADELVSAYLDGEAAPEEVAGVEANEELMARVTELAAVSTRLAAPLTPPPATRELHLAAALAAFDEAMAPPRAVTSVPVPAPVAVPAPTATVHPIEIAREQRTRRRFPGKWVAAAAAAALVVGFTAVTVNRPDDGALEVAESAPAQDAAFAAEEANDVAAAEVAAGDASRAAEADTSAASAPEETAEEEAVEEETSEDVGDGFEGAADDDESSAALAAEAAPGVVTGSSLAAPLEFFLGEFDSLVALTDVLVANSVDEITLRQAQITQPGLFRDCQQNLDELRGELTTLIGEATIDSMPVEVHLVPDLVPPTLAIVDKGTCVLLTTLPLAP